MDRLKPRIAIMRIGDKVVWVFPSASYETRVAAGACPFCLKPVVTALPPPLLSQQPDDTTHVCHPALGGCNQGFSDTSIKERKP